MVASNQVYLAASQLAMLVTILLAT